jgi:hypothetical protein
MWIRKSDCDRKTQAIRNRQKERDNARRKRETNNRQYGFARFYQEARKKGAEVCGPQCQREKKITELRQIYEVKKTNEETADQQLLTAHKNWITYEYGRDRWKQIQTDKFRKEVEKMKNNTLTKWYKTTKEIGEDIDNYDELFDTLEELEDFYKRIVISNEVLQKEYDKERNDVVTDDRKAFYEMQGSDELKWWYYWMKWLYIFIVIAFILACFLTPTTYSWKVRIILLIFLLVYPVTISFVSLSSFASIRAALQMLPYNTYTTNLGVSQPNPDKKEKIESTTKKYEIPNLSPGLVGTAGRRN